MDGKGGGTCLLALWRRFMPTPGTSARLQQPRRRVKTELRTLGCLRCRSARADGGAARDADRPAALADRVHVAAVGDVTEGEAAVGVGPGDLAAGAVVAERTGRLRVPEPAPVGVPIVTGDDDAEGAVGGRAQRQQIGERVWHPAGGVAQARRGPKL